MDYWVNSATQIIIVSWNGYILQNTNACRNILYAAGTTEIMPSPKFGAEQLLFVDFSLSKALPRAGKPRDRRWWSRSSSRVRTMSFGNVP